MAKAKTSRLVERRLKRINKLNDELRGRYLQAVSNIEFYVGNAIVSHFFPNFMDRDQTRLDLHWFVMNHSGISFRTRVSILTALLKARYPDIWKAHSRDIKKLDNVAEYRNLLAHTGTVLPNANLEKTEVDYISLVTFKNGIPTTRRITAKEASLKIAEAGALANACADIWVTIAAKNSPEIRRRYERR